MIITVDIGNTRTAFGLFDGKLVKVFRFETADFCDQKFVSSCIAGNVGAEKIEGAVICSVVENITQTVSAVIKDSYGIEPVIIGYESVLPVKLCVDEPQKLGADRIVNASYAYYKFNQALIVVDCGSAITFDVVDLESRFLGGIISPGLSNQLKSLNVSTSALPLVDMSEVSNVIGSNTNDAILSGVVIGTASMIDSMIKKTEKELGCTPKIVLTGGDSEYISKYLSTKPDIVEPCFTIEGLNYLYELNRNPEYV